MSEVLHETLHIPASGGAVGALYAGYEFLSSLAGSPEIPDAMASGCESMAWLLYGEAEECMKARERMEQIRG